MQAALGRSLSQLRAVASRLSPCWERGALCWMQEVSVPQVRARSPRFAPDPAPVSSRCIFSGGAPSPRGSCWSCQEPVLGECWSCSSFPGACIFSCLLVTSSSLPTPGIPSGYRSPAPDDSGSPGGNFCSAPSAGCHFQLLQGSFWGSSRSQAGSSPFPCSGQKGRGQEGPGGLVAGLAQSQGDVSPALADPGIR